MPNSEQGKSAHLYEILSYKHKQFSDEPPFGSLSSQSWNVSGDILVPLDTQVQVPSWPPSEPPFQINTVKQTEGFTLLFLQTDSDTNANFACQ